MAIKGSKLVTISDVATTNNTTTELYLNYSFAPDERFYIVTDSSAKFKLNLVAKNTSNGIS